MEKKYSDLDYRDKGKLVSDWLVEHKARDLVTLDLQGKNPLTEMLIIVSAASARQAKALADGLMAFCVENNFEFLRMEGYQSANWVLVDLNDIVVHIFQEADRSLYNLEGLWRQTENRLSQSRESADAEPAPE